MSICQRYRIFKCLAKSTLKSQPGSPFLSTVQTRFLALCCRHHDFGRKIYGYLCLRHFGGYTSPSTFRLLSTHSLVLKTSCSCLRRTEKLCSVKSNLMKFLTFKRSMSTTGSSTNFTLRNTVMNDYVDSLIAEYEELEKQTEETRDKRSQARLMELSPMVKVTRILKTRYKEMEELTKLQADPEMRSLAEADMEACGKDIEQLESELVNHLMTDSKEDDLDIILEVTAGVGGQEAMLFAGEMFDMYAGYAAHRGWEFTEVDRKPAEFGGVLFASAAVSGRGVYREMKFESGIHRVQRVPRTELKGRTHTSTMSVVILPQPSDIDIIISMKDVKVDTFRASGKGGQHVNVTDSAVRMTHLPTGMVAECQQDRSQTKNRATALKILRTRLYEKEYEAQVSKQKTQRKLQVGNKGRNEKIRTYNFPQGRITDHRLKNNYHNMELFMAGGEKLESMINELLEESKRENLQIMLDEFEDSRNLKQKQRKR